MINEKEYAKVIAVNLRNIMYERHLTQADLSRDLSINKADDIHLEMSQKAVSAFQQTFQVE